MIKLLKKWHLIHDWIKWGQPIKSDMLPIELQTYRCTHCGKLRRELS